MIKRLTSSVRRWRTAPLTIAGVFGVFGAAGAAACDRSPPPGADSKAKEPSAPNLPQAGRPTLPRELAPPRRTGERPIADAGSAEIQHPGPWFVVTQIAAAVYSEPRFENTKKLGYIRNGGKVPVLSEPLQSKECSAGWRQIVGGGFVCGNTGTTDLNHPQVKFSTRQPDLSSVLPYVYARNAKNGTPLYKSVPSRDQMNSYEPYLREEDKSAEASADDDPPRRQTSPSDDTAGAVPRGDNQAVAAMVDAGTPALPWPAADAGETEPDKPWWQREDAKDRLHEVKLEQLSEDADDILAKRMVTGFYVAVDRTFSWNGRTWYKTTKGLVAPADRMWQTAGAKFKGVELDDKYKLPIAWVYGGRKSTSLYVIDEQKNSTKPAESVDAFTAIPLTGRTLESSGTRYSETTSGSWIKTQQVRVARPVAPPADLAPDEHWLDVNLTDQTLVAYIGTRPVYATLVSSGKKSNIKDKDHRTPNGEFRIREKHVTTTMDGDGTAAGDLPYSIEDVPFVMYYNRSFAVHGAFWHRNYGVQMSHGCVNVSPLDAKHLFFFTDPPLPQGWHGVWASAQHPGSRIVIHD
jgi:lipoprotein-anchoring transpeptidase ErfK/SrfK